MRLSFYLLGLLFGLILGLTIAWEYFTKFNTSMSWGFTTFMPVIIIFVILLIEDGAWK